MSWSGRRICSLCGVGALAAAALVSWPGYATAQAPLLSDAEASVFNARVLPPSSATAVEAALGVAAPALRAREHVDFGTYRLASAEAAECVMQRAAELRLDIPQLFTDRRFGLAGGLAIVIDRRGLADIDRLFDLHSLFPTAATTTHGRTLHMQFLLVGNGRLIIGYDGSGSFESKEAAFHVFGGKYQIQPLIRMDVEVLGHRAFAHMATLSRIDLISPYGDFVGPMGSKVHGLVVTPAGMSVQAEMPWWLLGLERSLRVRGPAISRRRPLTSDERTALRARGCPAEAPWVQPS
jgi:hypothetical protein